MEDASNPPLDLRSIMIRPPVWASDYSVLLLTRRVVRRAAGAEVAPDIAVSISAAETDYNVTDGGKSVRSEFARPSITPWRRISLPILQRAATSRRRSRR